MAPGKEDLIANYGSKAAQVLPPITRDLLDALEFAEDPSTVTVISDALARAFLEGTALGATEMAAQAAENGITLNLNWLGGPDAS